MYITHAEVDQKQGFEAGLVISDQAGKMNWKELVAIAERRWNRSYLQTRYRKYFNIRFS